MSLWIAVTSLIGSAVLFGAAVAGAMVVVSEWKHRQRRRARVSGWETRQPPDEVAAMRARRSA